MSTPMMPDPRMFEWRAALGRVIVSARLVSAFDGTDRASLDALRDALYEFGRLDEDLHKEDGSSEA